MRSSKPHSLPAVLVTWLLASLSLLGWATSARATDSLTFSASAVNLAPTTDLETATPFTLTISVTNNTGGSILFHSFDIFMNVTPTVPEGTLKLDGSAPSGHVEFGPTGGSGYTGPDADEFISDYLIVSWNATPGATKTLVGGATIPLATLHILLEPPSGEVRWNFNFDHSSTDLVDKDGINIPGTYGFVDGFVATPEPSSLGILLFIGGGLLRRRKVG